MKQTAILLSIIFLTACKQSSSTYYQEVASATAQGNSGTAQGNGETEPATKPPPNINEVGVLPPPQGLKKNFAFATKVDTLAHDVAVKWDGCSKEAIIQGGYLSDTVCGKAYIHHPKFAQHLDKYFYTCLADASKMAGYGKPEKVFINHVGSYNDRDIRGGSSLSMHAYARAIDLSYITLIDSSGKKVKFSTYVRDYKGTNKIFYDEFRQCWKETMPKKCGSSGLESVGSIGIPGSALGGNSLHNDHIHLSIPLCAG